jgi:hypothetical protein
LQKSCLITEKHSDLTHVLEFILDSFVTSIIGKATVKGNLHSMQFLNIWTNNVSIGGHQGLQHYSTTDRTAGATSNNDRVVYETTNTMLLT